MIELTGAEATAPSAEAEPAATPVDPELADFLRFAGPNGGEFVRAFRTNGAFSGGICWPGVLLPLPWLLYRRLYGLAALSCVLPILASGQGLPKGLVTGAWAASAVLSAMGKRFYVRGARRDIEAVRGRTSGEEAYQAGLAAFGGVSRLGAAIGVFIVVSLFTATLLHAPAP